MKVIEIKIKDSKLRACRRMIFNTKEVCQAYIKAHKINGIPEYYSSSNLNINGYVIRYLDNEILKYDDSKQLELT